MSNSFVLIQGGAEGGQEGSQDWGGVFFPSSHLSLFIVIYPFNYFFQMCSSCFVCQPVFALYFFHGHFFV